MTVFKVGLIGCGVVSDAYLQSSREFNNYDIVACSDLDSSLAAAKAKQHGIEAVSMDNLFKTENNIQLILNLTPPQAHKQVNIAALNVGKHVYSEKPFALNPKDAAEILALAERNGLQVGSAPDSFLGAAHQTAKQLINSGTIGQINSGTASLMNFTGYTSDHPNLGFFFKQGGGPLLDMGPYYLTSLVDLLGPVKRVAAIGKRAFNTRLCHGGLNKGKSYPVEVDTHFSSVIEFSGGAVVTYTTSFDVWSHNNPRIELYGAGGSIQLPEPSGFGGEIKVAKAPYGEWKKVDLAPGCDRTLRGLGLSEMIDAIVYGREPKCSGAFAAYILSIICALEKSAASGKYVKMS